MSDLKERQRELKAGYRAAPASSRITLRADSEMGDTPITCSVEAGRAIHEAQAHAGVGGAGTAACSGDMLLAALAACAQITCQMVATAMGLKVERIAVAVEGDLDLAGTLGIDRAAPVGFSALRVSFDIEAPGATAEERAALEEKTLRYCVVHQTLAHPPAVEVSFT
jgi:uncharacterized OsmC-like protein